MKNDLLEVETQRMIDSVNDITDPKEICRYAMDRFIGVPSFEAACVDGIDPQGLLILVAISNPETDTDLVSSRDIGDLVAIRNRCDTLIGKLSCTA